jgi:hypothetical protein
VQFQCLRKGARDTPKTKVYLKNENEMKTKQRLKKQIPIKPFYSLDLCSYKAQKKVRGDKKHQQGQRNGDDLSRAARSNK